jgi:predicted dehydrogenase
MSSGICSSGKERLVIIKDAMVLLIQRRVLGALRASEPSTIGQEFRGHSDAAVPLGRPFVQLRKTSAMGESYSGAAVRSKLRKLLRFMTIYGPGRTMFKMAGRLRMRISLPTVRRSRPDIGVIGCGQFAFATIGYYLLRAFGRRIATCFDIDKAAQHSFQQAFAVAKGARDIVEMLDHEGLKTVYIASNHASHSRYAVEAIRRGLDVYIEKPISVTVEDLVSLLRAMRQSGARVFAGYNRPFSPAIRLLRQEMTIDPMGGFSIQCFVSGHKIQADHWYRRPEEGTRVCGNVGHWLDLAVHLLMWRSMPDILKISLNVANDHEQDDNLVIAFNSDRGDIFSLMLTSTCEPFEGINETINIQHANTICKIDDFRRVTIWRDEHLITKRFWPKNVGHGRAILQPFQSEMKRDWQEVIMSTLLMLHITDMVRTNCRSSTFSFSRSWETISTEVASA